MPSDEGRLTVPGLPRAAALRFRARILLLGATVALPLLLVAVGGAVRDRVERERVVSDDHVAVARAVATAAEGFLDREIAALQAIAALPPVRRFATASGDQIEGAVRPLFDAVPSVETLGLIGPDGWNVWSLTRHVAVPSRTINISDRPYFQEARAAGRVVISPAVLSRVRPGVPVVAIAVPLAPPDPATPPAGRGVLVGTLSLDRLQATLRRALPDPRLSMKLVDSSGQLLVGPDAEGGAARRLASLRGQPAVEAALAGEVGSRHVLEDGEERLVSFAPVATAGWAVLIAQPLAVALAPARHEALRWGGLLVLALAFSFAVAWILASRLGQSHQDVEHARAAAERQHERSRFLADCSRELAGTLDREGTLQTVARLAVPVVADWCVVDLVEDGGRVRRVAAAGADPASAELAHVLGGVPPELDPEVGIARVLRSGLPQLVAEVPDAVSREAARDDPHAALARRIAARSLLIVPVAARGRTLGAISLAYAASGRRYGEAELRVAEELARAVGLAIDNARLYREADAARRTAEAARRRAEFLARASEILASSLDYEATLAQVAELVVPTLADWCAVDVAQPDGFIRRVATAHRDPGRLALARELERRYPIRAEARHGVPRVIRTGEPEFYPEFPNWWLAAAAQAPEDLAAARTLELTSLVIVPMTARDRTLGAVTLITERDRRLDASDVGFGLDLARRAALALDNARLYGEAQAASRLKDEFLATVSHELRTPLNAIVGWAQVLQAGKRDEATLNRALESIGRNAAAQAGLVNDLLDVSRIVSGQMRLDLQPVRLAAVVEAAIETIAPAADAKRIRLVPALGADPGAVTGDPARLQQVVGNLLSNAVKFTPPGGRVTIHLERGGGQVLLRVSDTGLGISPDFLPHVFDRFRQADSSPTRRHGGLGLGLAIARYLVELHGGHIVAESPGEGGGATFTVALPAADRRPAPVERRDGRPSGGVRFDRASLADVRILVVEDEPDSRAVVQTTLEALGARVLVAASADEAERLLGTAEVDAILADIGMPERDGLDLIRAVRATPRRRRVPALAVTAYATQEDRQRSLAAGYDEHLPKPVDPDRLVEAVLALVGRAEPRGGDS